LSAADSSSAVQKGISGTADDAIAGEDICDAGSETDSEAGATTSGAGAGEERLPDVPVATSPSEASDRISRLSLMPQRLTAQHPLSPASFSLFFDCSLPSLPFPFPYLFSPSSIF
jgi:hypothetical protein